MAAATARHPSPAQAAGTTRMSADEKRVILASSLGTVFEWYDFYLFGVLAPVLAANFFGALAPATRDIFTLLVFAAGFAVRPLGALVFGRLGDIVGRKHTFLMTIVLMGVSTFLVCLLPNHASWGLAAPAALVALRLLQGLALGGEYGGAATYVAEHAPHGRRGAYTGWIQSTASLGLIAALLVTLATRSLLGEPAFEAWGWRIPYALSGLLLLLSVWMRLRLRESPAFARMRAHGKVSRAPLTESFARWGNLKTVVLVLLGATAGQAVVWYTGQFYALFFLQSSLKVDAATANLVVALALAIGTPCFVLFGALSDRIGRKPIIMAGCLLAALSYFPLFQALTAAANPKLQAAMSAAPVTVVAPAGDCTLQLDLTGTARFLSPCDLARSHLANAGVNHRHEDGGAPGQALVRVGTRSVAGYDGRTDPAGAEKARFDAELRSALAAAGYPAQADPIEAGSGRWWTIVAILTTMVVFVAMVYGPIAALLAECFPTRIRYSSVSLPYHIGNGWFGGFLPAIAFAIVAARGDIYSGLWYPVLVAAMSFVIGMLFIRETKDRIIDADD